MAAPVVDALELEADEAPLRGRQALVAGPDGDLAAAVVRALAHAGARVTACAGVSQSTVEGTVDILVTCTPAPSALTVAELTDTRWRAALDGGVTAAMSSTRDVLPLLRGNGTQPGSTGSSIVHIGSAAGLRGEAGAVASATSAAGLAGLTRSLARELGPRGVRVNMVAAGPVAAGRSDQVAAIAVFLASDASAGINGEVIVADGAA
jgi:3-oxoacyl-[acyl-carrier protein] reductase